MNETQVGAATPQQQVGTVFGYFTLLSLVTYLASATGYLTDFATSYMLKDQLHLSADAVARFRTITGIPAYFAFLFGFCRDTWNPFRMRDRGLLLIFGVLTALVFGWLAVSPLTYTGLLVGMLVAMVTTRFLSAAFQGLLALIGQEKLMSGRLTVVWQVVESIPAALAALGGGWVAGHLKPHDTFIVLAVIALLAAAMGFWKPGAVFRGAYEAPLARSASTVLGDLKRLVRHRAIYPAVLIMLMFQFAPGSNTPLLYYLTDKLHASKEVYGVYYATFILGFIPMFFVYGWLCKRVPLGKLLFWGTVITIPQMVPLALIHSAALAMWLGFPIGMMGGIATASYYDLAMRSCPSGLQGALMMAVSAGLQITYRFGDLLGAKIYDASPAHGFLYCVIATSAVYALILPVLLWVPKELVSTADGQANPALQAAAAAAEAEAAGVR